MKHITHKILLLVIALTLITIFWVGWKMLYPYNPLEFKDEYFPVTQQTLKQGETMNFLVRYCKHMPVAATVHYQFVNSVIFQSSVVQRSNAPAGCGEHVNLFEIPRELPPGRYRLVMILDYDVSLFRTITTTGATEEFNVVE